MKKRKLTLRMADGGIVPVAAQVSPYSIRGIAGGLRGAYDGAVGATANGMATAADVYHHLTPDRGAHLAAPMMPAPVMPAPSAPVMPAPTVGGAIGAIQSHQQLLNNLADGTPFLHGPGGPTDDKIPAKLSRGEAVLPADTVQAVGPDNIRDLIDKTHTPVKGRGLRHFANGTPGIDVSESPFTDNDARLFGTRPAGTTAAPQPTMPGADVRYAPSAAAPAGGAAASMPGVDVSERPMATGESRMFARDPGPGNPNVTAGGSPEARAYTGLRAADIGPPRPPTSGGSTGFFSGDGNPVYNAGRNVANLVGGVADSVEGAGRSVMASVKPLAGRAVSAAGDFTHVLPHASFYTSDAPVGDKLRVGAADLVQGLATGAGAAFGAGAGSAIPGPGSVVGALAGGTAGSKAGEWVGDKVFGSKGVLQRDGYDPNRNIIDFAGDLAHGKGWTAATGGQGLRDAGGGRGFTNPALAAPDAGPAASAAVAPGAAGAGRGSVSPAAATAPPLDNSTMPGAITRVGNTFSNVTGDAAFDRRGSISPQNDQAASALAARSTAEGRVSLRGGADPTNLPAGYGTTIPGVNAPGSAGVDLRDPAYLAARAHQMDLDSQMKGLSASQRATVMAQRDASTDQNTTARRGQDLNASVATRGQDVNADVARAGQRVSMRGQDLSYDSSMFGHNISAAGNRARLQYEMGKDNREFGLRQAEFGQRQGEAQFNQGQKADEALQKNLEARYRTTDAKGNNVPDSNMVGQYRSAVNATIPALAKQLEATGNPQAIAKAQDLRARGAAALDPTDHDRLQQLFDTRNRMSQARGLGPNQGTFANSDNLLDYRQLPGAAGVEHRLLGGNRIVTPAGSVSARDLQYDDGPANSFLPDFNRLQSRNLTRGLRTE